MATLSPPLESCLALRDSIISNTIQQKCCFVNSKAAFTFVTGTLVLGIVSCHVRKPTMLRPPGREEAKAMLKRPCIGVLVARATEIPVDSQPQEWAILDVQHRWTLIASAPPTCDATTWETPVRTDQPNPSRIFDPRNHEQNTMAVLSH